MAFPKLDQEERTILDVEKGGPTSSVPKFRLMPPKPPTNGDDLPLISPELAKAYQRKRSLDPVHSQLAHRPVSSGVIPIPNIPLTLGVWERFDVTLMLTSCQTLKMEAASLLPVIKTSPLLTNEFKIALISELPYYLVGTNIEFLKPYIVNLF